MARRFPVMLTFDLDEESGSLFRDPSTRDRPQMLAIGRYGSRVGVARILDLLDRQGIKATFFVPGWVAERRSDCVREIAARGHEVGHHGYMHEWPSRLESVEQERAILEKGLAILEEVTGRRPVGYRAPAWELSNHTLRLLREYGFSYSTNFMDDDGPYLHAVDGQPSALVELPTSWLINDVPFFSFSLGSQATIAHPDVPYHLWTTEFEGLYREEGKCVVLTHHPSGAGRHFRIALLERFILFVKEHPEAYFARCDEVAAEVRRRLSGEAGPAEGTG
jgi:peptidoglycan/xylan/chitin deacetylase (PgdA/CDA1 family)